MTVNFICVGKIKEKYLREALDEYAKRLSKYCRFSVTEVADEKTPDIDSALLCEKVLKTEGERILSAVSADSYVIATAIDGKKLDSVAFSDKIKSLMIEGKSNISFIIGGSLGLDKAVRQRADMLLSFSDMTFPHQLMRVILAEQVYRSFRIMNNEPYHK